jgi:hypothetical protein
MAYVQVIICNVSELGDRYQSVIDLLLGKPSLYQLVQVI